jgi:hypothetical protein
MTEGRAENKYGFDMQVSERHMAEEFSGSRLENQRVTA